MSTPAPSHVDDSRLLVFGASGSLGTAVVEAAQRAGAWKTVVGCGCDREPPGDPAFRFDLRSAKARREFFAELDRREIVPDACVYAAGLTRDALLARTSLEAWNDVIAVNLTAAFGVAQELAKRWLSRRRGHLILIGSHSAAFGRAGQTAYAASKAGLVGLAQSFAREYGRRSLQCNVVLPGLFDSPMTRALDPKVRAALESQNALGRASELAEIAAFILHLARMRGVSGQSFAIDSRILPGV
ncbi:MAG: SDR family oxidoreductase [Verrucomicrobiae bacterium]|nr:SDR family oxidoreductase [Verrucomicrobiae bacterium]